MYSVLNVSKCYILTHKKREPQKKSLMSKLTKEVKFEKYKRADDFTEKLYKEFI